MNSCYVYDKGTGHYFCKYCGNNYLLHEHKSDCSLFKDARIKLLESEIKEYQTEIEMLKMSRSHWEDIANQWKTDVYNLYDDKKILIENNKKQTETIMDLKDALFTIQGLIDGNKVTPLLEDIYRTINKGLGVGE